MLINFDSLIEKYGKPKGVIHIGAHLAEEQTFYLKHGLTNTIWIEANPKIYDLMKQRLLSTELAFNYAITDKDNDVIKFNVTNNGQSSSILELDEHKKYYPNIHVTDIIDVNTKTMKTLLQENNIEIKNYDFLNLDIQGAELLALIGFEELLNNFKYIYSEVNMASLYQNCATVEEIDSYLNEFGFTRIETYMTPYQWADAFYIKKEDIK